MIKNLKKNTIILLLITFIVLYVVLKDDMNNIITTLGTMKYIYVLIAILFFFFYIVLRAYVNYLVVDDKEKYSFLEAIKHNIIVLFFNGITPFSTGGQPMEVYLLTEHKIRVSKATNVTIQNFIFYQVALVIYGILAVSYNAVFHIFPKVPFLRHLVLLGFLINTLVIVVLAIFTFSDKWTKKIIHLILKIAKKIGILKKHKDLREKLDQYIDEFQKSSRKLLEDKRFFIKGVALNFIALSCLYIIPLFLVLGLNSNCLNIMDSLTASAYTLIVGSFVPIPGASGGIEYSFTQFFGNFIDIKMISAVLLIWRFITYYLGMIIGAILFNVHNKEVEK